MKTLKVISSVLFLLFFIYFVSCDIIDPKKQETVKSNFQKDDDGGATTHTCPNPNNCNWSHFCLTMWDGETRLTIIRANVNNYGYDCANGYISCEYVTGVNLGEYNNGCFLPWGNEYCKYTRDVCAATTNGTYTGSVHWEYPETYCGIDDAIYQPETACDFGGIEKQGN